MGTSKITGLGDPTAAQDAASKNYADTTFLGKAGGTMTGAINMGSAKVTTTYTPTNGPDLTNKTYVDSIVGSGASAASSATAAASSATAAATSSTNAGNSATAAASSATSAAASYDSFDDRYLGAKSSAPALDNDGDALIAGALYFNTTTDIMYVYGGSGWQAAGSSVNGTSNRNTYTATAGQTSFAATYDPGYVDAYLNGVKLINGTDFTATSGTSIVLASGAAVGDTVDIVGFGTFVVADTYTKTQADARYVEVAGDTMTGDLTVPNLVVSGTVDGVDIAARDAILTSTTTTATGAETTANAALPKAGGAVTGNVTFGDNNYAIFGAGSDLQIWHSGTNSHIRDAGTGNLLIQTNGTAINMQGTSGENYAIFNDNGAVTLNYDNNLKFSTTATGISVTGSVDFGNWTITESGGSLYFATGGSNKMKLDASGNLDVVGNVNSNATIT